MNPADLPEEITRDPAMDWCDAHQEELAKCGYVAVHPTLGIVADAHDGNEFATRLWTLSPEVRADVLLTHGVLYGGKPRLWSAKTPVATGYYAFFGWPFGSRRGVDPPRRLLVSARSGHGYSSLLYEAEGHFIYPQTSGADRAIGVWAVLDVPDVPTEDDLNAWLGPSPT